MKKFYLETFGCKFNQADSQLIRKILKDKGYQEALNEKEADFFILNTCGVVEKTERKIIKRATQLKKRKKKIIFAGCLPLISQVICQKIADGMVGPTNILELPQVVKKVLGDKKTHALRQESIDKAKLRCFFVPEDTVTAIVPIAEGCLASCTYCSTKFARGKLRSFDENEILENIKLALNSGAKEIQLTSQDLAIYGVDRGSWVLPDLLKQIIKIKEDFRVRLGMMNPFGVKRIFKKLLKIMENEKIYKFLHLPLQSGDDEVLRSMKRNYKAEEFLDLVRNFKSKFKNSILATDIIVGFPTETERAFLNTQKVVNKLKPEILHIFRFSKREYTVAAQLKDLPERIKKERSRILTKVWFNILNEENKKYLGKTFSALITEKRENRFLARLSSYKAVILDCGSLGKFVKVRIIRAKPNYLVGKITND